MSRLRDIMAQGWPGPLRVQKEAQLPAKYLYYKLVAGSRGGCHLSLAVAVLLFAPIGPRLLAALGQSLSIAIPPNDFIFYLSAPAPPFFTVSYPACCRPVARSISSRLQFPSHNSAGSLPRIDPSLCSSSISVRHPVSSSFEAQSSFSAFRSVSPCPSCWSFCSTKLWKHCSLSRQSASAASQEKPYISRAISSKSQRASSTTFSITSPAALVAVWHFRWILFAMTYLIGVTSVERWLRGTGTPPLGCC
jgi:hypothetical protein